MFEQSEIDRLPVGLIVRHTPVKVHANKRGSGGLGFEWRYRTGVSALADAAILGFAGYDWDGRAWAAGKWHAPAQFAGWHGCPDARLRAGEEYVHLANRAHALTAERMKWVYVAETLGGRRVKGEAVVELLPELNPGLYDADAAPADRFQARAELFRHMTTEHAGVRLDYDEAGVRYLDAYIERLRGKAAAEPFVEESASCFLGECIRRSHGGEWVQAGNGEGDGWGIRIRDGLVVFPFDKLGKQLRQEFDDGESIASLFTTIAPLLAGNAPKAGGARAVDGGKPAAVPSGGGWKFWRRG